MVSGESRFKQLVFRWFVSLTKAVRCTAKAVNIDDRLPCLGHRFYYSTLLLSLDGYLAIPYHMYHLPQAPTSKGGRMEVD